MAKAERPKRKMTRRYKRRVTTLVAETDPDYLGLFWDGYSDYAYGPGFHAFANDFPEGTKLRVTAEIILPEEADR